MERSMIIGFVLTIIIALVFSGIYIVFVASKEPTPPKPTVTQPTTTPITPPKQPSATLQTTQTRKPPLQVPKPEFQPALSEPEAEITMTRQIANGGTAVPGGTLTITILLEKKGAKTIRALGIQELLPDGWSFDGVIEGAKPDLTPPPGRTPLLEFAWFNIPPFPISFTYRVKVSKDFKEVAEIQGQTLYRADGGELRTDVIKSPVVPSGEKPATTPPVPDQSPSGKSEEMQPDSTQVEKTSSQVKEEKMTLAQVVSPDKYTPNSTLEVKNTVSFAGSKPVTAIALVVTLPSQFQFEEILDGPVPPIAPKKGDTGTLNFVWPAIPTFPFTLTYKVSVVENATGDKNIVSQVLYHTDGPQQQSERIITPIPPASK